MIKQINKKQTYTNLPLKKAVYGYVKSISFRHIEDSFYMK